MLNNNSILHKESNEGDFFDWKAPAPQREGANRKTGVEVSDVHTGLSYAHIRPKKHICSNDEGAKYQSWDDGSLIKASKSDEGRLQVGGGKRMPVKCFSRAAARRMRYGLNMMKRCSVPVCVDLTFPTIFDRDPAAWKRDLKVFFQRLSRWRANSSAYWRMELKVRKSGSTRGQVAPHFHLLVWGVSVWTMREFVKVAWWEVVGSGNEDAFEAGTRVARARSMNGVKGYVAKYVSKYDNEAENFVDAGKFGKIGRLWGKFNADLLPVAAMVEVYTTNAEVYKIFRLMRAKLRSEMRKSKKPRKLIVRAGTPSMTLIVNDPVQWKRAIK